MPEVTFGGIPAWLLATYLTEMGGTFDDERTIRGDGWTATLTSHNMPAGGLGLGRVTVAIEGVAAEATMAALRKKAQRGGG